MCEQVGGIEWFAREQRGMQALQAPEWREPEKHVLALRNLEVRGRREVAARQVRQRCSELSLRGRPRVLRWSPPRARPSLFMYHVSSNSLMPLQSPCPNLLSDSQP